MVIVVGKGNGKKRQRVNEMAVIVVVKCEKGKRIRGKKRRLYTRTYQTFNTIISFNTVISFSIVTFFVTPHRLTPPKREPHEPAPPRQELEGWKAIQKRIIA
jgi:hypothetical protein